jgi:hypothetical protein
VQVQPRQAGSLGGGWRKPAHSGLLLDGSLSTRAQWPQPVVILAGTEAQLTTDSDLQVTIGSYHPWGHQEPESHFPHKGTFSQIETPAALNTE